MSHGAEVLESQSCSLRDLESRLDPTVDAKKVPGELRVTRALRLICLNILGSADSRAHFSCIS